MAFSLLLFAGMLVPIGLTLFLGEWVFGSMGWGILHGTEVSVAGALVLVVVALGIDAGVVVGSLVVGTVVGVLVAVVLALNLTNRGWTWVGDQVAGNVAAENRPLVVGVVVLAVVFGALGLLLGLASRSVANVIRGLVIGVLLGAGVGHLFGLSWRTACFLGGALTAIALSVQVAAAIGLSVGLLAWTVAVAFGAFRSGIDTEALKARFMPSATIDTTKESIEWIRERAPMGRR